MYTSRQYRDEKKCSQSTANMLPKQSHILRYFADRFIDLVFIFPIQITGILRVTGYVPIFLIIRGSIIATLCGEGYDNEGHILYATIQNN